MDHGIGSSQCDIFFVAPAYVEEFSSFWVTSRGSVPTPTGLDEIADLIGDSVGGGTSVE